jgi:hypothetical protein
MEIALAEKQPEVARTWLEMLRVIEGGNPDLIHWEMRIEGPGEMLKRLKDLGESSPRKKVRDARDNIRDYHLLFAAGVRKTRSSGDLQLS